MRQLIVGLVMTSLLVVAMAAPALAGKPGAGTLWLDNEQVRTLVPPAAAPHEGRDPLYVGLPSGPVAGVGPGDKGYHGGDWAVYVVDFNVEAYPLTSAAAILAAEAAGHVDITRNGAADFRCPIQP